MTTHRERRVWQIAAGDPGRDYSDLFIRHDLMLIGPGRFGKYDGERFEQAAKEEHFTGHRIGQVRAFCTMVSPGDIVLLRTGHRVEAVGVVHSSGYDHEPAFDDVYGWDLQHMRRVLWQEQLKPELDRIQKGRKVFGHMKEIPTLTRVVDRKVLDVFEPLFELCHERKLRDLPPPPSDVLESEKIGTLLFAKGLPNEFVDRTLLALQRQKRLARWYEGLGKRASRPREHEVVAHMVLPLLLALGWSEQLLAVEWNRVDLTGFAETPTDAGTCVLVCEAKELGHGLQDIFDQARRYVSALKLARCKKILLTEGQRLYVYQKDGENWGDEPAGYINVHKIRENHIAPAGTNAIETIVALTPMRIERPLGKRG